MLALPAADPRLVTQAHLLHGICLRDLRDEQGAAAAFKKGIAYAANVTKRTPSHLCDLIVLHNASKSWSREDCTDIITTLLGSGKAGDIKTKLQSAFISTFLTTNTFVQSLNTMTRGVKGQAFCREYALRTTSPRELSRRIYVGLIKHYIISSVFGPEISDDDLARVDEFIEHLMDVVAISQGHEDVFFTFVQAWSSPALLPQLEKDYAQYPEALVVRGKWLLAQRYLRNNFPEAAQAMLKEIQAHHSLDPAWQAAIAQQMK